MIAVDIGDIASIVISLATIAGILLATYIIARVFDSLIRRLLRPAPPLLVDQVARGLVFFIWLVGFLLVFTQLGLNLDIIILLIALAGLTLIVAARDLLPSILSRYLIGLYIPLKKGDEVQIAAFKGKVMEMNQFMTILMNDDGFLVVVPNSLLLREVTLNLSSIASRRITLPVSIPSRLDFPKVEAELLKTIYKYRAHLDTRFPPTITIRNTGPSSVEAEIEVVAAKADQKDSLGSELSARVNEVLDRLTRERRE